MTAAKRLARLEAIAAAARHERKERIYALLDRWESRDPAVAATIEAWMRRGDVEPAPDDGWMATPEYRQAARELELDPDDPEVADAVWRASWIAETPEGAAIAELYRRAERSSSW